MIIIKIIYIVKCKLLIINMEIIFMMHLIYLLFYQNRK